MADGSIRVPTKIDLAGLKKGLAEMKKELAQAEKECAALEKQYHDQISRYKKRIAQGGTDGAAAKKEMQRYEGFKGKEIDAAIEKVDKLKAKLSEASAYYDRFASASDASKQVDQAMAGDKFVSGIKTQEQYNSLLAQTKAEMARIEAHAARISKETGASVKDILSQNDAYQKAASTAQLLKTRSKDIRSNIRQTKKELKSVNSETKKIGDSTRHGIMGFGKMGIALMAVRFAMRAISAATREYMATNSQLEGQMNTLKALWGQVLGPAIQWVVNLLIKAVSAVNAFVYALTGINLVAKANAAALKKQATSTTAAAKAQRQLAGFDEQTKLSDTSGGGGGGGGAPVAELPDGLNMDLSFLDPLMEAIKKFKEDISPLLETVGNLFKWLWNEVLVPFGDWAANGLLPAFLNILGGAALVLNDALEFLKPTAQWLWDNILKPVAEWTGGVIVDVLNAIGDWIHKHHETLGKVVAVVGALVAVIAGIPAVLSAIGAVLGFLFSPVTLIVAAIAGLVAIFVTCYDECEGFRAGMDQVWQGIKDIFFAAVDFIKALFNGDWAGMDAAWERIKEAAKSLWEGLVEGLKAGWEWCKEKVADIWGKITTKFKEIFGIHSPSTVFADFGKNMMEGLVNGIKNAISKVANVCKEIWTAVKNVFSSVGTWFKEKFNMDAVRDGIKGAISKITSACKEVWSAIKNVFSSVGTWFKDTFSNAWKKVKEVFSSGGKIFDGIKDGISSAFKTIVNKLIDGINKIIKTPFDAINKMLNTIRSVKVLGVTPFKNLWSQNPLSVPKIPKLAVGGIVNRPGRGVPAIIGEAGAEAVLPLENNTEWMDILADKIGGGNITIPITLDGKRIATYVVDIQKKKAFAMNGA